jgi:hypothetical protein
MAEPSAPPDATDATEPADAAPPPAEPTAPSEASTPPRQPRWRRFLVGFLVVVVCLLTPVALTTVWLRRTLLNTDQFVSTLGPLADDPAVQQALANRVTNALINGTDLEAKIKDALPQRAKPAAPFIAGGAQQFVQTISLDLIQSDRFQNLWDGMLRRAHSQVVAVLQGKGTDRLSTKNGQIVLQVGPVAQKVLTTVQSKTDLFDNVDTTSLNQQIVLADSKDLRTAQGAVDFFNSITYILPIVLLVLLAIAIWLSGNRRRTILRTALGIALGMALLLTLFNLGRSAYLDALPRKVNGLEVSHAAATAVYDQVLSFLRTATRTAFVLAIIVAIAAWLSGPGRAGTRLRAAFHREPTGENVTPVGSFVGRYRNLLRVLVIAIGVIILIVLKNPTPLSVLVITVLVLIGLVVIELLGRRAPAAST